MKGDPSAAQEAPRALARPTTPAGAPTRTAALSPLRPPYLPGRPGRAHVSHSRPGPAPTIRRPDRTRGARARGVQAAPRPMTGWHIIISVIHAQGFPLAYQPPFRCVGQIR